MQFCTIHSWCRTLLQLQCGVNVLTDVSPFALTLGVKFFSVARVEEARYRYFQLCYISLQLRRMYWITGRKSKLSLENKLLIDKNILKPIWTYGIPLWGTASNSKIEILQRFQNKVLGSIVNAPRYVPNTALHTDLQIPTVKAEITNFSTKY